MQLLSGELCSRSQTIPTGCNHALETAGVLYDPVFNARIRRLESGAVQPSLERAMVLPMPDQRSLHPRITFRERNATRTILLDHLPFSIGRSTAADLCINHPNVSRSHVLISQDEEGYFVRDVGSRHGTLLNGARAGHLSRLHSGDNIQLGAPEVTLHFVSEDGDGTARSLLDRISLSTSNSDIEKLALFLEAAQSFNHGRMLVDVLTTMLEYTLRVTCAERGFIFFGDSASNLKFECGRNREGVPLTDATGISQSIVRDAAKSGLDSFVGDTARDDLALGRGSIIAHELRSIIAIPLWSRSRNSMLGMLYLDSHLQTCNLSAVSRDVLAAISREAATFLETARMMQAEHIAQLLQKELEIAAAIQRSIIPRDLPKMADVKFFARIAQCTEVGGDFYDLIPVIDGIVAVVADVSGKGISAAILASVIQGMIYAQVTTGVSLVECFTAVNSFLCSRVSGQKYATIIALLIRKNGTLEIVNGGHVSPVILMPDGKVIVVKDGDVPVGLFENAQFHAIDLTIPPGSRVALFSDGLSEAEDDQGVQFGLDEISRYLTNADPVEAIFSAVDLFCQGSPPHDDRTLLTVERLG